MAARRAGRRSGSSTAKDDILDAARKLFSDNGFDRTTLRMVAENAGVDAALISHYFRNKQGLFVAAVDFPADPQAVLAPLATCPQDQLAATALRHVLAVWDSDAGPAVVARLRQAIVAGEDDLARTMLIGILLAPLRKRLPPTDRTDLRLSLFASQIAGLLMTRQVVRLPSLTAVDHETLVELVAPNLQRYLTGEL